MAEATERVEVAPCPNPKCGKPVWSDHKDAWCYKCGEYFPDEFAVKLPRLMADRATRSQVRADAQPSQVMEKATPRARVIMGRYRDAYRVANVIIAAGNSIKVIGFVLAAIMAVVGLVGSSEGGVLALLAGFVPAAIIGVLSWLSGVLLNAQGQLLLASLDGVISVSPFLTDEERAEVMTLP